MIHQLKPKEWIWNDTVPSLHGRRGAGLIAQDVEEVLPFAVVERGKYLALNYDILHAYQIALLQNLEARLSALEEENRELKKRLGL